MSLLEAARRGGRPAVAQLLQAGAAIDAVDANGCTALLFAAMSGHPDVVQLLLEAGADVTIKDGLGYTAYYAAMLYGDFRGGTMPPYDQIMAALAARGVATKGTG